MYIGNNYFGARYYNSDISMWLSVDPMSDKYPSLNPYNYCAGNPVMLVDPDGMEIKPNPEHNIIGIAFRCIYPKLWKKENWENYKSCHPKLAHRFSNKNRLKNLLRKSILVNLLVISLNIVKVQDIIQLIFMERVME